MLSFSEWFKISDSPQSIVLGENSIGTVEVNGKMICIAKYRDGWFAFNHKCPHASGILSDGYIDAIGNVVCPVHRYRFNLRNGRNSEGYFLKVYPLEERADGVYVKV